MIAAGGDGTCNEVLNGVMKSNTNELIGFIPIGSGNDIPGAILMFLAIFFIFPKIKKNKLNQGLKFLSTTNFSS